MNRFSGRLSRWLAISAGATSCFVAFPACAGWALLNGVPHTNEFGSENPKPSSYYWCGHAALKIAESFVSKKNKSLGDIHNIFYLNSSAGYGGNGGVGRCNSLSAGKKYCASLQDLAWAQYSRNNGYGRVSDKVATNDLVALNIKSASTIDAFYSNIKDAISANNPVISPSNWKYNIAGHFWVVVGYQDGKSISLSSLYLRDVSLSAPAKIDPYGRYDLAVTVGEFYAKTANGQMLIVK